MSWHIQGYSDLSQYFENDLKYGLWNLVRLAQHENNPFLFQVSETSIQMTFRISDYFDGIQTPLHNGTPLAKSILNPTENCILHHQCISIEEKRIMKSYNGDLTCTKKTQPDWQTLVLVR